MTPVTQFQRYVWLVDTLQTFAPITKEEIDRRWMYSYLNNDKGSGIHERTFHRDLHAIESIFGVDVHCNRATNQYSLATKIKEDSFSKWIVETMAMSNFVAECKSMRKHILIEDMPSAVGFLHTLLNSIKTKRTVRVTYKSYFAIAESQFEIEPYCLKSFKRRWYVLAKTSKHDDLRILALDRLANVELTDCKYSIPSSFDAEKYFRDYYGVIMNEKTEKVRLWTTSFRANYLRSLPLHHSQKEVECVPESAPQANDGYSIFEMKVAPTFDLIQELRSLGAEVKVLAPQRLADWLKLDAEKVVKLYKE